jgi:hypothetical protein
MRPVVSQAAEDLYAGLGPWAEEDGEATDWALLYWCGALTSGVQKLYIYTFDDGDKPGWSILVDLDRVPAEAMGYLAQYVGVQLPTGNTAAQNRDLILNRPGWKRGRPATIVSAVQQTLVGTKRVNLLERDTSAYHATIQTYRSQTPDSAATEAAIAAAKPGALIIDLVLLTSATFTEVSAVTPGGTFADRLAAFPTFGDVLDYVP